jgi:DNA-binding transcriptional MerR regulator/methylmalonyl-CoA mutase cobalamin-binding subunit
VSADGYRIGTVAQLAGLTTHAIRVWERRYGAAAPSRSAGGARLYSDDDVQRFRLIKRLLEQGYSTRAIANLDLSRLAALAATQASAPAPAAVLANDASLESLHRAEQATEAVLDAVAVLDVDAAERALQRAANDLSPRELVTKVLAPALQRVGERWASGALCTASEHAASALLRTRLGALLAAQPVGKAAPVVCTTPSGEQHELGALLVAVLIAMHGRRALFLGANLPAEQIAEAARMSKARAVALSLVSLAPDDARRELRRIRKAVPASIDVAVGGRGSAALERVPSGVRLMASTDELEAWLDAR